MTTTKPKRFRLSIVGAIEDQPRLIRAYGRVPGGEIALVLSPLESRGILLSITKARTVVWEAEGADSPLIPESPAVVNEAIQRIREAQTSSRESGPTTLRGRWAGHLIVHDGVPQVALTRKLATYGVLRVTSHQEQGWKWHFERGARWFTDEDDGSTGGFATLSEVIEAGVIGAMQLVRPACAVRDTRRRAALDAAYAAKRPIRVPADPRDPTERLGRRRRRAASPPQPVEDGLPTPEAPRDAEGVHQLAEAITREAGPLTAITRSSWLWEDPVPLSEIASWFDANGFLAIGKQIRDYGGSIGVTRGEFITQIKASVRDAERASSVSDPALFKAARRQIRDLSKSVESAPAQMARARMLLRYTTALVHSPRCQGAERQQAMEALQRAVRAYEDARIAIVNGDPWDAVQTLRRIGERVALTAAKAAKACAHPAPKHTPCSCDAKPEKPKRRRRSPRRKSPPKKKDTSRDQQLLMLFSEAISAATTGPSS